MFRTRALFNAASKAVTPVKSSTGIVGIEVVPNAREILIDLYKKTLEEIKTVPQGSDYRTSIEQITSYRLSVVEKESDIFKIEDEISCGQVEELIIQAEEELDLIPFYLKQNWILETKK
eukprot:maker-scaffold_8-snap-gene-4.3-mRNA-1 protein AED:0.19 eAED:0.19 QI:63/1/1/1/1/1/3/30/118